MRAPRRGLLGVSLAVTMLILVLGVSATVQSLPPSCGAIGAGAYHPSPIKMPKVVLKRGTVINVTTNSDAENGNISSVKALLANPGPDGISLREAVDAMNNSPGTYTIEFAPTLKGATINVGSADKSVRPLSLLSGNVTIDGNVDSDGRPDITINNTLPFSPTGAFVSGFQLLSSYNTLYSLNITNFQNGVTFNLLGSGHKFSNNTLAKLTITSNVAGSLGVNVYTGRTAPIWTTQGVNVTRNSLINTLILNNTISTQSDGINFQMTSAGDQFKGIQIIGNNVADDSYEIINLDAIDAGANGNQASNVLIAYNHVVGSALNLIRLSAGSGGGWNNKITDVTILGNDIRATSPTTLATSGSNPKGLGINAIDVTEGDGSTADANPNYRPITYPINNSIDLVFVAGNTLNGFGGYGVWLNGGCCGTRNGRISNIYILGNTFDGTIPTNTYASTGGVHVDGAFGEEFPFERQLSENLVSNVTINDNTIALAGSSPSKWFNFGGLILRGGFQSTNSTLNNVKISSNNITAPVPGIQLQGGFFTPTTRNSLSQVQISCNILFEPSASIGGSVKWINIEGGISGANSNIILGVTLTDNIVGGILNDFSSFPDATPDSTANTINLLTVISHYTIQFGKGIFPVAVQTNSSISDLSFSQSLKSIAFSIDGPSTAISGYVNATLPKSLLNGTLTATADGSPIPLKLAQNSTHYFVYASYPGGTSTLQIALANVVTMTTTNATTATSTTAATSTSTPSATTTTSTSTSTATSSEAISITLPTVSVTTPSATTTSIATASTSSGGGGIPEFPIQLVATAVLTFLVVASYLLVRRNELHFSPRSD